MLCFKYRTKKVIKIKNLFIEECQLQQLQLIILNSILIKLLDLEDFYQHQEMRISQKHFQEDMPTKIKEL
jgi:hypothetical protein